MATNFFEQQDDARRKTGRLVAYFALAVGSIVLAIYLVVAVAVHVKSERGLGGKAQARLNPRELWDPKLLLGVTAGTLLVVLGGSAYKVATLRAGGAAVARSLDGRPVDPGTADPAERRLLNVVEEMALASGTPVPPVYLLDDEPGINAFAAGHTPGDAVVGVTRGAVERLTRDELQGVIAHEFSHILNGDMRLDTRLMGLLHGILMIAIIGEVAMRWAASTSSSGRSRDGEKKDSGGGLFLLGLALFVIGWVGVFFGRLIKSAVSRQREYLADSAAVQFTRNPAGIAGALKKIAVGYPGSRILSPRAEEASHMFFGNAVKELQGLDALATHPPIAERILRIEPTWDFTYPDVEPIADEPTAEEREDAGARGRMVGALAGMAPAHAGAATIRLDAAEAVADVGAPRAEHVAYATALVSAMPEALTSAVREPFGARCVVYALLLDPDEAARGRQLEDLRREADEATYAETLKLAPPVGSMGAEARVPLVDLALPALRNLSGSQYEAFRDQVRRLVEADEKISLFEFVLQRMLMRHLDQHFGTRAAAARPAGSTPLFDECAGLLSELAHVGNDEPAEVARAFGLGMTALMDGKGGPAATVREVAGLDAVDRALGRLASAPPKVKRRVLDACAACITADGRVTVEEAELLRAIADSLDCPMPPLMADRRPGATAVE